MIYVRPAKKNDINGIMEIVEQQGLGITSLPKDRKIINKKIDISIKSFKEKLPKEQRIFLFVAIDDKLDKVCGISSITAFSGYNSFHYSLKVSSFDKIFNDKVYNYKNVSLCTDLTGFTKIGSLLVHNDYKLKNVGKLLSFSRLMFIGIFKDDFSSKIISEIRGNIKDNDSDFYNFLGKMIFRESFAEIDYELSHRGNDIITSLFPQSSMMIEDSLIGVPHEESSKAMKMLLEQGFFYNNYIDVIDGGPTIECETKNIKAIKEIRHWAVSNKIVVDKLNKNAIIANNDKNNFLATFVKCLRPHYTLYVKSEVLKLFNCKDEDFLNQYYLG